MPRLILLSGRKGTAAPANCGAALFLTLTDLPNPYSVPELKNLNGLTAEVQKWLADSYEFEERVLAALAAVQQMIAVNGRVALVATCFGGKHRSVAFIEAVAERLHNTLPSSTSLLVRHTELNVRKELTP